MIGVARITKLDFFIMKSQGILYLSLVAVILLFGLMGSSITVLCITGAWFMVFHSFCSCNVVGGTPRFCICIIWCS